MPFSQGRATVHLTHDDPHADCRFVNQHTANPGPTPGPDPRPGESAEISVEKTLVSTGSGPTPTDTYLITVKNTSAVTADHVVVSDEPGPGLVVVSVEPSAGGTCMHDGQYTCVFDSIAPHGQATVLVKAKDYGGGSSYNRAIVGSASPDQHSANNVDSATAKAPARNYPACGSSVTAHASC